MGTKNYRKWKKIPKIKISKKLGFQIFRYFYFQFADPLGILLVIGLQHFMVYKIPGIQNEYKENSLLSKKDREIIF